MSTPDRRPAAVESGSAAAPRLYALIVGVALVLGGIAGFFYDASFGSGNSFASDDILGTFPTNGWGNCLHLAVGLAGLWAAGRAAGAYALTAGGLWTLLGLWGLLETDRGFGTIADLIPVGTELNLLHLALGLTGIAAGLAGRRARA